jgi:hypothetical protein
MGPDRPKRYLLAALGVVLVLALAWSWRTWQAGVPLPSSYGTTGQTAGANRPKVAPSGAADVHLKSLNEERAKPTEDGRNPFRFKPKPAPPPAPANPRPSGPPPPSPTATPAPPTVPPITLKFIGLVQTSDRTQRLAVLSDGRGSIPFYGKEGDIIEGRYRIVRIGTESIEMTYLDGRGRQTIRLSGG